LTKKIEAAAIAESMQLQSQQSIIVNSLLAGTYINIRRHCQAIFSVKAQNDLKIKP